jgi:DNA-directed RNA polymerase sigma subunit (sigma70/sigma32)
MKQGSPESKKENILEKIMTDGMTQHEVAAALNISRSQVDTIEKMALRKIRYLIQRKYNKEDFI